MERPTYLVNLERVISAFCNPIDRHKVDAYKHVFWELGDSHDFPNIMGWQDRITQNDLGKYFMNGERVRKNHLGLNVWYVTDGHHRVAAAIESEVMYHLLGEIDKSTLSSTEDMQRWDKGEI